MDKVQRTRFREIVAKSALSRSRLTGLDWALNPYRGCGHGCLYCYSPAVIHYDGREAWGDLVEARTNLPVLLARELRRLPRGTVGIGTVTDPYQPAERRYRVTRHCLEQLLRRQWPICIQTKSATVVEDIDLIGRFSEKEVGLTFTSADDTLREWMEPGASPIGERLRALGRLRDADIPTFVFFGPVLPGLVESGLEDLFGYMAQMSVGRVLVDRLRMHPGVWERVRPRLVQKRPELVPAYEAVLFGSPEDYEQLLVEIADTARRAGISSVVVERP
ncbi:MAG: radical SAM protein [Euryarchaeota archaeon]|nr:radical SAM protein [Euryarchaeota archaeon]